MKEIWDTYVALFTWQTGIPIAFNAAIAIAVIVYTTTTSTYNRLRHSITRGCIGFVLSYAFVWLLIGSKLNIHAMWWSDKDLRNKVTWIIAFITGIIIGIIIMIAFWYNKNEKNERNERDYRDYRYNRDDTTSANIILGIISLTTSITLGFLSSLILGLLFQGIFAVGDFFFPCLHYILYIAALIGLPILFIVAVYFIYSKLLRPAVPLIVFLYLTFSTCTVLMYFLSSTTELAQELNPNALKIVDVVVFFSRYMVSSLTPLLFLSGPFVLMITVFHFRQTIGTWVGSICGLFTVTLIQLVVVKYPWFDKVRDIFRNSDLTWIFTIYAVFAVSSVAYYLWTLNRYQKGIEKKVENLNPILAIGAVMFNVCFLFPVIVNSKPWLWGAWFAGTNLLIGLVILFGRLWVVSQKSDWDKYINEK